METLWWMCMGVYSGLGHGCVGSSLYGGEVRCLFLGIYTVFFAWWKVWPLNFGCLVLGECWVCLLHTVQRFFVWTAQTGRPDRPW